MMNLKSMAYQMVLIAAVVGVFASDGLADDTLIDDFETYKNNEVIGSSYDSKPWRRFGTATNENVVATRSKARVISGSVSAQYSLFWPNRFGSALYTFDQAQDISQHRAVRFMMRSNEPSTGTVVRLAINDGTSTYLSKDKKTLTDKTQEYLFSLAESDMELVDGPGQFPDVVQNAACVGFQFESGSGRQYIETIFFDDLAFTSDDPEDVGQFASEE